MIIQAKAVKNQCLSRFCQKASLTATTVDEARFLALLHRVVALGGTLEVEEAFTGRKAKFVYKPNELAA